MNATAGEVTVRSPDNTLFPADTAAAAASFAGWTSSTGDRELLAADYPERRHYGRYLRAVFDGLVPDERIAVVWNGTPEIPSSGVTRDRMLGLFLSNLRRRKGVVEAVDAARIVAQRFPDVLDASTVLEFTRVVHLNQTPLVRSAAPLATASTWFNLFLHGLVSALTVNLILYALVAARRQLRGRRTPNPRRSQLQYDSRMKLFVDGERGSIV